MGTRRSRHNKGRKPLYKEHGTDSVRFGVTNKAAKEKFVPVNRPRHPAPSPLSPKPEQPKVFVDDTTRTLPERVKLQDPPPPLFDVDKIEASSRDILITLFIERKIDRVQLNAGRLWQHYMEEAIVQPCMSIDPSAPLSHQHWQRDGDLTERQHRATIVRKIIRPILGRAAFQFLDTLLQPDIGRKRAMEISRMSGHHIAYLLNWLLSGLAVYFGYRNSSDGDVYGAFQDACATRENYRLEWNRLVMATGSTKPSVGTWKRFFAYGDAKSK
jgi:hypothetical protein